jgi:predicted transcriptional regulator
LSSPPYSPFDNNNNNKNNVDASTTTPPPPTASDSTILKTKGHLRKSQARLLTMRREQVFLLSSRGYRQAAIANRIGISQPLVNLDLQYLKGVAKAALKEWLSSRLPVIISETLEGVSDCIRMAHQMLSDPNVGHHDRIHLIALIGDLQKRKLSMAANAEIIGDSLEMIEDIKKQIIEISPQNAERMLHSVPSSSDEDDDDNDDDNDDNEEEEGNNYNGNKNDVNDNSSRSDNDDDTNNRRKGKEKEEEEATLSLLIVLLVVVAIL